MEYQKKISKSGGITIPSAVRVNQQGEIVLTRIHGTCIACGGHEKLAKIKGKFICRGCVKELIERNLGGKLFHANDM